MYTEKNTGTNLPAQIDIEAVEGMKSVSYTHLDVYKRQSFILYQAMVRITSLR